MEYYDFSQKISEKTNIKELNSKTLSYRVNGIIHACNFSIEEYEKTKKYMFLIMSMEE